MAKADGDGTPPEWAKDAKNKQHPAAHGGAVRAAEKAVIAAAEELRRAKAEASPTTDESRDE